METPLLFIIIGSSLALIGSVWQTINKNKADTLNFQEVLNKIISSADSTVNNFNKSISGMNDSIIESMTELENSQQNMTKKLENYNSQLAIEQELLEGRILALSNPLEPFKIKIWFELDYKECSKEIEDLIARFSETLKGNYQSYFHLIADHRQFILQFNESNFEKGISVMKNKSYSFNPWDIQPGTFEIQQYQMINNLFPSIQIAFISKEIPNRRKSSYVLYDLYPLSKDDVPINLEYRIDIINKIAYFAAEILNNSISQRDGIISSLEECKGGKTQLFITHTKNAKIKINSFILSNGKNMLKNQRFYYNDEDKSVSPMQTVFSTKII